MKKIYEITEKEYEQVEKLRKTNINKKTDKKLRVITLRYEGYTNV